MQLSSAQLRTLLSAVLQPASGQPDNSQVSSLSRSCWLQGQWQQGWGSRSENQGSGEKYRQGGTFDKPARQVWSKV